jgi:hypothetical protein
MQENHPFRKTTVGMKILLLIASILVLLVGISLLFLPR